MRERFGVVRSSWVIVIGRGEEREREVWLG